MSDLQLSLFGLGAVLVAGVWLYNKLQERKYRKAAEKVFGGEQADVLAPLDAEPADTLAEPFGAAEPFPADERREPGLPPLAAESMAARIEPTLDSDPASTDEPSFVASTPTAVPLDTSSVPLARNIPPSDWCDESIDLIARLSFDTRIAADDLRQAQSAMQAHQRVPLRVFVELNSGRWQALADAGEGSFSQAWFALQLVDRRGAVSTNDFEALRNALQALASLRNGGLMFPDVAAMGEQARALDEFCAQLDLQLAINVLDAGQGAFPGTKIRGMAEAAGMKLSEAGEFQALDENGNFMYALVNMGDVFSAQAMKNLQTHGVTFLLDVPHVRDGGYAFERMLSNARQFANSLDAALVNAQRAPVSDAMIDAIRKKIHEIHEQMTLAGIPAGGVRALRLFS